MEIEEIGKKALAVAIRSDERELPLKPRVNVLDEDSYVESLEKIITKDFFPDLPKLQAQAEYLDAVERKDTQKIWELQRRFSTKRAAVTTPSVYSTPSTFDTPDGKQQVPTPSRPGTDASHASRLSSVDDCPTHNPEPGEEINKKSVSNTTLDKFLARNTSEDNTSFVEIMNEAEKKHRVKHAWLFDKVGEQLEEREHYMTLPSIEQQALEPPTTSSVQTWTYEPKNAVMYVPDGVPDSPEEKMQKAGTAREIMHKNTRFSVNPFSADKSHETISQAASAQARVQPGRIGPDGKEILPSQSPHVGGYGFVASPSLAPGVDASPLMTWGEIEGTPFRLDGSDTPLVGSGRGPTFKIPEVPRRDRLLHALAEKASKAHRAKREAALKQATASFNSGSPSPKFGMSKTDRLQFLSPAAQTLASRKLGIRTSTDRALKASYTPSPTHRLPGDKTPTVTTPTPSPGSGGGRVTPGKAGTSTTPKLAAKRSDVVASLTDNLLNLPKRAKAQDFF